MGKVVVVGSCNLDFVIKLPRLPKPGETVSGGRFSIFFGGKGANQAAAAKLAGAQVEFVGKIGKAELGITPVDNLRRLGVGLSAVAQDSALSSGTAFILVGEQGQNLIGVAPGANASLLPADLSRMVEIVQGAKALLVQLEVPLETVEHALRAARAGAAVTIMDPAPVRELPANIYKLVDIITPNQSEAEALTALPASDLALAERAARTLLSKGVKEVIVTLGPNGALLVNEKRVHHLDAVDVGPVDTTAAGDAFNGALAAALADDWPLEEAAAFANCAAALSVTKMGAQSSLPEREQIEALYRLKISG